MRHHGLKRFLWVQVLPGTQGTKADIRFEGGFAVDDAPEPWGQWTTVYFTEKWDVGPGETASFPTKWMSADGKALHPRGQGPPAALANGDRPGGQRGGQDRLPGPRERNRAAGLLRARVGDVG
jgi:hypothetical protein